MKNILMAVQPKWLAKILNGEKTDEIRKTIPELPCIINWYCTLGHGSLFYDREEKRFIYDSRKCAYAPFSRFIKLNGLVVAKCVVEKVDVVEFIQTGVSDESVVVHDINFKPKRNKYDLHNCDTVLETLKKACLSTDEYMEYGKSTLDKGKPLYALHLTALTVFDKPMELSAFTHWNIKKWHNETHWIPLTRSPQSWQYVEVGE